MVDPIRRIGQQYAEIGEEVGDVTDKAMSGDLAGAADNFVVPEEDSPLDYHIDVVWEGHKNDQVDLVGPAVWVRTTRSSTKQLPRRPQTTVATLRAQSGAERSSG